MKLIKVLRFDESCKFIVFLTDDDRYVFIDLADEKFTVDPESVFYLRYGIWNMKAPQYMIDKAHEIFNSGKGRYIKENPWTKGNLYEKKMLNAYKYHLIPRLSHFFRKSEIIHKSNTAPTKEVIRLPMSPPPALILSKPNTQPPMTPPTIPTSMLTKRPKPPPLMMLPASHPATAPIIINHKKSINKNFS